MLKLLWHGTNGSEMFATFHLAARYKRVKKNGKKFLRQWKKKT